MKRFSAPNIVDMMCEGLLVVDVVVLVLMTGRVLCFRVVAAVRVCASTWYRCSTVGVEDRK